MKRVSSLYGDGQFHLNERTGEYRKKLKRNLIEVRLPSGITVYEVKYAVRNLHTQKRYSSLEEAEQFMAMCQNLLDRERVSKHTEFDEKDIIEYPETLLKALGISQGTEGYYDFIIPEFDERFEEASAVLSEREKYCIIAYFRNLKHLEQIGKEMNVTRERIRQMISKGLRKLQGKKQIGIFTMPKDKYYLISQEEKDKMIAEFKERLEADFENATYEKALEIIKKHQEKEEEERQSNFLNYPYAELNLSVRSCNCLRRAGIKTIGDITNKTRDEMMKIRNLGKKSLKEITDQLAKYSLTLKGEQLCNSMKYN